MFVIVNKPHGLLVHSTDSSNEYTLRDILIENFNITKVGDSEREGIVHRLDRVTSGLMICPISSEAFNQLQKDFKNRKIVIADALIESVIKECELKSYKKVHKFKLFFILKIIFL